MDQLTEHLAAADQALADATADLHQREIRAFHSLHDEEGHAWAGKVDELQHIRDLIRRLPFTSSTP
jgi:hypothetical protein